MTDSQQRRLIGGILALVIGVVVLAIALQSVAHSNYGAMAVPAIIGALLAAGGVYLLLRFLVVRRQH